MQRLKPIEFINLGFFLMLIITDIMYMTISGSEYIFKTLPTATFVLCGLANLVYVLKNRNEFNAFPKFKYFMMLGLFFAALGDIFLIDLFIVGVIFFALGHVFYFISFCMIIRINLLDFIVSAVILIPAILLITLYKGFDFDGLQTAIIIYAIIISFMTGKTISNLIRDNSKKNLLLIIGSIMFFLSDLVLLFRMFADAPRSMSILCVALYYPAQAFLAYSINYVSKNEKITTKE